MKLIVEKGASVGREFRVQREVVVGRLASCAIPLDDKGVSREHARVFVSSGTAYVADLGSSNGTFVNGKRVSTPMRLHSGDRLVVGETTFRFHEEPRAEPIPVIAERPRPSVGAGGVSPSGPADIRVKKRILQFSPEKDRPKDGVLIADVSQRSFGFRFLLFLVGVLIVGALTYGVAVLVSGVGGSEKVPEAAGSASEESSGR